MTKSDVTLLLVEDDEIDVEAIIRAFRKAKIANPIHPVKDGIDALKALRGESAVALPRPFLILLDINLPRMNGLEFLTELRRDAKLKDSVVFVLTTSNDDRDVTAAYEKQVAGYILKSRAGEDFITLISMLDSYWRIVELPSVPNV